MNNQFYGALNRLQRQGEPKPENGRRGKFIGGYLPAAKVQALKEYAQTNDKTIAQLLEEVVTAFLDSEKNK